MRRNILQNIVIKPIAKNFESFVLQLFKIVQSLGKIDNFWVSRKTQLQVFKKSTIRITEKASMSAFG